MFVVVNEATEAIQSLDNCRTEKLPTTSLDPCENPPVQHVRLDKVL